MHYLKSNVALIIANDEYPDLIYAKSNATDLYAAGALIDMTDLIEKYGPNIKKCTEMSWKNYSGVKMIREFISFLMRV